MKRGLRSISASYEPHYRVFVFFFVTSAKQTYVLLSRYGPYKDAIQTMAEHWEELPLTPLSDTDIPEIHEAIDTAEVCWGVKGV